MQCYAPEKPTISNFLIILSLAQEVSLVLAAILVFLLACYAFFYLKLSEEVDLDLDEDEN